MQNRDLAVGGHPTSGMSGGSESDKDVVPASIGQRLLWLLDHYHGADGALNVPLMYRVRGQFHGRAFEAAIADVTARHEALRTSFTGRGPRLRQVVNPPRPVPVRLVEVPVSNHQHDALLEQVKAELGRRIDIHAWPTRATVFRLADDDHVLCLNAHHLVTDGLSSDIVAEELAQHYRHHVTGAPVELDDPVWQYRDFTRWQAEMLEGDEGRRNRRFWTETLDGMVVPPLPRLPPPPPRPEGSRTASRPGAVQHFVVPAEVSSRVLSVGRSVRATGFASMLAVFYVLLSRLTDETDITVASLYANRSRPELRRTVGFLPTLLLLRTRLDLDRPFAAAIEATRRTTIEAFLHQGMPYHLLTRGGGGQGALSGSIFQMIPPPAAAPTFEGLHTEPFDPFDDLAGRFDLELVLIPHHGEAMDLFIYFTADAYDAAWVDSLGRRFVRLAAALADAPHEAVSDVPLAG